VSCPDCGAEVSVWARECPRCRRQLDWPQPEAPPEQPAEGIGQPARLTPPAPSGQPVLIIGPASREHRPEYFVACQACAAVVPSDATWCPRCGVPLGSDRLFMTGGLSSGADADRNGVSVGWGPRRRLLVLATAVVGVLIVVALVRAGTPGPSPRAPKTPAAAAPDHAVTPTTRAVDTVTSAPVTTTTIAPPMLSHKSGTTLLLAGPTKLSAVDLDRNSSRTKDLPPGAGGNFANNGGQGPGAFLNDHVLLARGRLAVFQAGGQTVAVPADLSRQPFPLGQSVSFIASMHADRVWLLALVAGVPGIREVDMQGRVTSPSAALPTDWWPVAAVDTGLLLSNGATYQVWDPHRGRAVGVSPPSAQPLASNGRLVVWTSTFGCQLLCATHITDVVAGTEHVIYPRAGYVFSASFSPDGRNLALSLNPGGDPASPGGLLLVDTSTYSTSLVSIIAATSSAAVWAPSGKWLFFLNAGGGSSSTVFAYQLGAATAEVVNLPSTVDGSAIAAF
jgi:hypothetical protein